jgi:LysM repeat protein
MTGIYYVEAADWLRGVGLKVTEVSGWQTRARSSGGFASAPLGVQWHHTASKTTPQNDTNWQYFSSSDRPIGNATIMRDGSVWIGAAGAANTAGKGGPLTMSRGTIPLDGANSRTWAFEVANNGVGEPWPQVQIDAYFAASNEMNKRFGNKPTDVFSHAVGKGNGWTSRKIDPATAAAVQGPWKPRSVNSSGTWDLDDIRAECSRRAGSTPTPPTPTPPTPTPPSGSTYTVVAGDSWWGISQKLGTTVDALLAANPPATSSTVIHPGDKLNVPGGAPVPPPTSNWVQTGKDATTPPGSPSLSRGTKHSNVTWLQSVLCSMNTKAGQPYYNPAWVDIDRVSGGPETAQLFGDASFNALAAWQRDNGVGSDGVWGNQTAARMASVRGK